jgi:DNA-binding CsgD family transcriptional regulator
MTVTSTTAILPFPSGWILPNSAVTTSTTPRSIPGGVHGGHLLAPGKVIYGESICTSHVVQRSEFYADFLRPNGNLLHSIVASVDRRGPNHSIVALTRPASAGAFDSRAHRVLSQLMPHFQRALALQRNLAEVRATADWHAEVVDRLPVGIAMISATGRVIEVNRRARELLAQADGLTWEDGYLSAQLSGESRTLHALIRSAAQTGAGKSAHPGGPISVSRPSGRPSFKLLVCPYRPSPHWRGFEAPSATVFITDPEQRLAQSAERLVARYGLTFAEAGLAMRLIQGESIAEAAAALNITEHTARTHLKRAFAKTGTTRQPELVRQLLLDPESYSAPGR